jgi:hypothetical protein
VLNKRPSHKRIGRQVELTANADDYVDENDSPPFNAFSFEVKGCRRPTQG